MPTLTLEGDISEELNGYDEEYIVSELHGDFQPETIHPDGSVTGYLKTEHMRIMPAYAGLSGDESEAVWMPIREFEGLHGLGFALKALKFPKFKLPKMPKIPKIKLKLPKLKAPKFKMPKFKMPKLKLPKLNMPKIDSSLMEQLANPIGAMNKELMKLMPGGNSGAESESADESEEQTADAGDESAEESLDDSDMSASSEFNDDISSEFDSGELGFLPALMAAAPLAMEALPMVTGALSSFKGGNASGGMGMVGNLLSSFGLGKAGSAVNSVANSSVGSFANQMLQQKQAAANKKKLQQAQQKQMLMKAMLQKQKLQTAQANRQLQAQKAQAQKLQASSKPVIIKQAVKPRYEQDNPAPYTPTVQPEKKWYENLAVMIGGAAVLLGGMYVMTNNTNKRKR